MIDTFIRIALGPVGSKILDYYLVNALWINSIIFIYAAAVLIGRKTYIKTLKNISVYMIQEEPSLLKRSEITIEKILKQKEIPWDIVLRSSRFPLITKPGSWRIQPKTSSYAKKLINSHVIAEYISDHKTIFNGNN